MADRSTGRGVEATRTRPVYTPVADIYENEDALVLLVEMPGVRPDRVEVGLDKRVLTIAGQGGGQPQEGYSLAVCEYRPGDYERVFTLSDMIDESGIEAVMKDGLLRLTLPKAKATPAKTIKVKVG
jgi:HSP20 family protein